jgi:hypothetical protein
VAEEIRGEEMGATRVTRDEGIAVVATLGKVTVVAEEVVLVQAAVGVHRAVVEVHRVVVEVHRVVAIPGEGEGDEDRFFHQTG